MVDFSRTSGKAGKEAESALRVSRGRSCGSEVVLSLRGHRESSFGQVDLVLRDLGDPERRKLEAVSGSGSCTSM